ncbi:MAG TPA: ATP-binding protein [Vicinamibacteria bacterium]|nr:ATP-binding protein [Vicinamibacteria bacterium]
MAQGRDPLRVGVLGEDAESDLQSTSLADRFEVVRADDLAALVSAHVDLALLSTTPEGAPALAEALSRMAHAPPAVILVNTGAGEHPHSSVVSAIVQAKEQWEKAFDAIVDPVAILDRSGIVARANRGLAEVLGLPFEEVVRAPYAELLGPPLAPSLDPIADSLRDGEPRTHEARFGKLPGLHQVTTSPYRNDAGEVQGVVVIIKDVTSEKEQQERLLRAARLADVGLLAGGVAHEINTPLASIALRAESLLKAAQSPDLLAVPAFKNFPRYLKTIDEEIFRCKKIIGGLLEFSRVRKLEARAVDLNALAERAHDLVGHQLKLKQVALDLKLAPRLPLIHGDDSQLRQALVALLMNALDASSAGGHIEVATRRDGEDGVVLSVTDDGTGIPPENLDRIFNPFFTTKPVGQGTGLGLAMCHGIVASHGGDIRVESKPGSGTCMSLLFPATASPPGAS